MSVRYSDAGIDLEAAAMMTARINERLGNGLFGGFLPVSAIKEYEAPVLVSSIDGIGTKVRLAMALGQVDGLGKDIVHHCVNDIAVHGARPLFFLDYLAFHRLDPDLAERLILSIADACSALGIALAGGETAEMPLVYREGHADVAGAIVGVVEQAAILDGQAVAAGDVLLGLPSSGLHTNGFSLVQRLFGDEEYRRYQPELEMTLGAALLMPHRCYLREIQVLLATGAVHGIAHITGGGIAGNLARIIPGGLQAAVELPPPPPVFRLLAARGVPPDEMRSVFNLGIGLIAVCDRSILSRHEPPFPMVGTVQTSDNTTRRVVFRDGD